MKRFSAFSSLLFAGVSAALLLTLGSGPVSLDDAAATFLMGGAAPCDSTSTLAFVTCPNNGEETCTSQREQCVPGTTRLCRPQVGAPRCNVPQCVPQNNDEKSIGCDPPPT